MELLESPEGIVQLAVFLLTALAMSNVLKRAGFSRWWALLGLVPVVNLLMLLVFAFIRWPRH